MTVGISRCHRTVGHRSQARLGVFLSLALAAIGVSACGSSHGTTGSGDPGITGNSIRIAASLPLSGPAASYGQGAFGEATYFAYLNAHGGVKMGDGKTRKIMFKFLDDAYDPARTVTNVRQLVETFHPAVLFNLFGTENVQAVYAYAAQNKVPILFPEADASPSEAPYSWLVTGGSTYALEMKATVTYINTMHPGANKIALLYQDDDYGAAIVAGVQAAIKGTDDTLVAKQNYSVGATDVSSQMDILSHSGATAFINSAIGSPADSAITTAAQIGWDVPQFIAEGAANAATLGPVGSKANGLYATLAEEDPTAAQWANTPSVVAMRKIAKQYAVAGSQTSSASFLEGIDTAMELVYVLEHAKEATPEGIIYAAAHIKGAVFPLSAGGLPVHTTPGDPYGQNSLAMWRLENGIWKQVGRPVS